MPVAFVSIQENSPVVPFKNIFGFTSVILFSVVGLGNAAIAQIIPDNTLGAESSTVVENFNGLPLDVIFDGAERGRNLFHSFEQFNVAAGREAIFFTDNALIENILARVTGNDVSEIFGVLRTFGGNNPNLFLINPNGIVFGESAQLNVAGSFVATTAESVLFPDNMEFSAANPSANPLLSVNVPIGLQFGQQPAPITSSGLLALPTESSLVLAGGPITLDNGLSFLLIPADVGINSGRIELAAVGGPGTVDLTVAATGLALGIPDTLQRANITLQNEAFLSTIGNSGGGIALYGDNLTVSDNSTVFVGISEGLGTGDSQIGDIRLDATGQIVLSGGSFISNSIEGTGSGGNVLINAPVVEIREGATVSTSNFIGTGDGGDIVIQASDRLQISGIGTDGVSRSDVSTFMDGVGLGGDVVVETRNLEVVDGANISTLAGGVGDAGNIRIRASDRVLVSGAQDAASNGSGITEIRSSISSNTSSDSISQGGMIEIETAVLEVRDGASLNTDTNGAGDAGSLVLNASERIRFSDSRPDGRLPVFVSSFVGISGTGRGGTIEMRTPVLEVLDGTSISADTLGTGDAGNILIEVSDRLLLAGNTADGDTGSSISSNVGIDVVGNGGTVDVTAAVLEIRDGGSIAADTFGVGNAGNVTIRAADRILVTGNTPSRRISSRISSDVESIGVGTGGNLEISTAILEVEDGAQISSSTFGRGDAGDVVIDASDRVSLIGDIADLEFGTSVGSSVQPDAIGNGGNVEINTAVLEVQDAQISSGTFSTGNAGNIVINATDRATFSSIDMDGVNFPVVASSVDSGTGSGGTLEITTSLLEVSGEIALTTLTAARGDGGNLFINADRAVFRDGASAQSGVLAGAVGNGGNIELTVGELQLLNGGQIIADTQAEGNAGNVTVLESDRVLISGAGVFPDGEEFVSGIFTSVDASATGDGGTIHINTGELQLREGGSLIASTGGAGNAGAIVITASDRVVFSGTSASGERRSGAAAPVLAGATGDGGSLLIDANSLQIEAGAVLTTTTLGNGVAGQIRLRADDEVTVAGVNPFDGRSSGIFSTSESTATRRSGEIEIEVPTLRVLDGAVINAGTDSDRPGGSITVSTDTLEVRNGGQLITSTSGAGTAGDIQISAAEQILLAGVDGTVGDRQQQRGEDPIDNEVVDGTAPSGIFATTGEDSTGAGGTIRFDSPILTIRNGARIAADSQGTGDSGDIRGQARTLTLAAGTISATSTASTGGNVTLQGLDRLSLDRESQISASTRSGQAGSVAIGGDRAPVSRITLGNNSQIATAAQGTGNAGRVDLNVSQLTLTDGSNISASTRSGTGGDIDLQGVATLDLSNSRIVAETRTGTAGSLSVNATDSPARLIVLDQGSRLSVEARPLNAEASADQTRDNAPVSIAGDLTLNTAELRVLNGSRVTVSSPNGQAGNLSISAPFVLLDRNSQLTAVTGDRGRTEGANIDLSNVDLLVLQNNSLISAEALAQADGGNVTIDAQNGFIVGAPEENSDILASAEFGNGGRIDIVTQGIFGLQFRPQLTPLSDISASSEFGLDGTVVIDTPGLDPSRGLAELPGSPVDASQLVAQVCPTGPGGSDRLGSFTVTGRGGLPPGLEEMLSPESLLLDWVTFPDAAGDHRSGPAPQSEVAASPTVVEAQGWRRNAQGEIVLVAETSPLSRRPNQGHRVCP
ncbi:MAG: filamentous hemagglutinin N-terminal domain-containing protein [Elainellaceae cyanobacterium]